MVRTSPCQALNKSLNENLNESHYSRVQMMSDFGYCAVCCSLVESDDIFRPQAIQSLTCSCTLLLLGSLGDIFGGRRLYLLGCILQSLSSLACGLSRTGTQLIVFRALKGLSSSFCLPSAVSIINHTFMPGRKRSLAFASMGGGNPAGFGLGLLLGGVFAGTIGWRWGFYITAIVNSVVYGMAVWQLPKTMQPDQQETWRRLRTQTDWVGVVLASTSLALLSYVLAYNLFPRRSFQLINDA